MNLLDDALQALLGTAALTAMFMLCYSDQLVVAVVHSVMVMASFTLGRGIVKLLKRRKEVRTLADE